MRLRRSKRIAGTPSPGPTRVRRDRLGATVWRLAKDGTLFDMLPVLNEISSWDRDERTIALRWTPRGKAVHTALRVAAERGQTEMVEMLAGSFTRGQLTVAFRGAVNGKFWETAKALVLLGADAGARGHDSGDSALHVAAWNGSVEGVRFLLQLDIINVNAGGQDTRTPLMYACRNGHHDVARMLLAAGADVNAGDLQYDTPLLFACQSGDVDTARLLLEHGALLEGTVEAATTPLHWACWSGNAALVQLLLEAGAVMGRRDADGLTPLHVAANEEQEEIAIMLVRNGAKLTDEIIRLWDRRRGIMPSAILDVSRETKEMPGLRLAARRDCARMRLLPKTW